jgi:phosphoribosyl-AMP cyclohydrolase
MGLPLLPVLDDVSLKSESLSEKTLQIVGQVLVECASSQLGQVIETLSIVSTKLDVIIDNDGLSTDQMVQLIDAGAAKVVVTKSQLSELSDIPADRLLLRTVEDEIATPAGIEDTIDSVAGVVLDSSFTISIDPETLKSIVSSTRTALLPYGGERTVYMRYSRTTPQPTIAELESLALLSIIPALPSQYLTTSTQDHSHLSIAKIALLGAKTDRADGLYTTVVTDERGHALGLVYSSLESVAESIKTGTGVYQSRARGLWYKGATSGATQEIQSMSWDCDADCLRYTVRQAGKGNFPFMKLTQVSVI